MRSPSPSATLCLNASRFVLDFASSLSPTDVLLSLFLLTYIFLALIYMTFRLICDHTKAPSLEKKGRKEKEYSSSPAFRFAVCALFAFSGFFYRPENTKKRITESGIESVVGRSDIKPTYREIAQAFELDFDFVSLWRRRIFIFISNSKYFLCKGNRW